MSFSTLRTLKVLLIKIFIIIILLFGVLDFVIKTNVLIFV